MQGKRKNIRIFSQKNHFAGTLDKRSRIKPNKEKLKPVLQIKSPTSGKELKSSLEAIQNIAKIFTATFSKNRPNETTTREKIVGVELDRKIERWAHFDISKKHTTGKTLV